MKRGEEQEKGRGMGGGMRRGEGLKGGIDGKRSERKLGMWQELKTRIEIFGRA